MTSIYYIIICIGLGLIINQWRNRNLKGVHKGQTIIPKGHSIYIFNPYGLVMQEIKSRNIARNEYDIQDMRYYEEFPKVKYDHKKEVAIIALNWDNAVKKARHILIQGGYDEREARETLIEKAKVL